MLLLSLTRFNPCANGNAIDSYEMLHNTWFLSDAYIVRYVLPVIYSGAPRNSFKFMTTTIEDISFIRTKYYSNITFSVVLYNRLFEKDNI